jgi:hypothetical protein
VTKKRSKKALVFPSVEDIMGIDLTIEERQTLFKQAAETRRLEGQTALESLERIVKTNIGTTLLAAANFHVILQNQNKPGDYEDPDSFGQWHIEILQAIVCANADQHTFESHSGEFLDSMEAGFRALVDVHVILQGLGLSDSLMKQMDLAPRERRRDFILSNSWLYASVQRNFAWPEDLDEVYSALFSKHDEYAQNGARISQTYSLLGKVASYQADRISIAATRLNAELSELDWDLIAQSFKRNDKIAGMIESLFADYCSSYLVHDRDIRGLLAFSDDLINVPDLFNSLSLNTEPLSFKKIEHLLGENPVHTRPYLLIKDQVWACFTPGTLHTYRHEHALSTMVSEKERQTFYDARTDYLEAAVAELLQAKLQDASVFRNIEILDPHEPRQVMGESDLVMTRHHLILIAESKSAALTKPARRGADNRVQNWLADNAVSGSDQARRMVNALSSEGHSRVLDDIRKTIHKPLLNVELVVCIEPPPFLFSRSTSLLEAGLIDRPIVPVMSIFELRVAARLLDRPYHFAHYLWKRCSWEHHSEFEGDGIDLLALYLHSPAVDTSTPAYLMLMSLEVDKVIGRPKKKHSLPKWPAISLTKFWRRMVEWSWSSGLEPLTFVLLDTDYYDQQAIEKQLTKLKGNAVRNWSRVSRVHKEWRLADGVYLVAEAIRDTDDTQEQNRYEIVYDISRDSFSVRGMHTLMTNNYVVTGASASLTPQNTPGQRA